MAPPSTPDKYPSPAMFDDFIKVRVGVQPDCKDFYIHKGVASFHSGYFEGAMKDCFKEGQTGVIELPTETVEVFERFIKWLYTRQWDRRDKSDEGHDFLLICKVWVFSDCRQIPLLMNDMITELRTEVLRLYKVPTDILRYVYEDTTPTAELRRYLIQLLARSCSADSHLIPEAAEKRTNWPRAAIWDVLELVWVKDAASVIRMGRPALEAEILCVYHRHEEGVKCPGA